MSCCPPNSLPGTGKGTGPEEGIVENINDLSFYSVGNSSSPALIVFTDIFGYDSGRHRVWCDELAKRGFLVVMADHFRGTARNSSNFPPKDRNDLIKWMTTAGDWETVVKKDLEDTLLPYLKEKDAKDIGCVGFCWGGGMALHASALSAISAAVGLHCSGVNPEMAAKITSPFLFLNAGNDNPLDEIKAVLDHKPFGSKCGYHTYEKMVHGWTVRGDVSQPEIEKDVADSFAKTADYLVAHLAH